MRIVPRTLVTIFLQLFTVRITFNNIITTVINNILLNTRTSYFVLQLFIYYYYITSHLNVCKRFEIFEI